jgi:OOP family OmpA-OmpF porin
MQGHSTQLPKNKSLMRRNFSFLASRSNRYQLDERPKMRTTPLIFNLLGAALLSAGAVSAHAADGRFYDPRNAASPTGKTIGYELYRTIGCPGRGLLDTPCPVPKDVDSDGDGVVDSKDKCPDTPKGTEVDANGCPIPVAAPVEPAPAPMTEQKPEAEQQVASPVPVPAPHRMVLEGVNFNFDRAALRPEDRDVIDKDFAKLKEWGDVKIEVAGHTDSIGSDATTWACRCAAPIPFAAI